MEGQREGVKTKGGKELSVQGAKEGDNLESQSERDKSLEIHTVFPMLLFYFPMLIRQIPYLPIIWRNSAPMKITIISIQGQIFAYSCFIFF